MCAISPPSPPKKLLLSHLEAVCCHWRQLAGADAGRQLFTEVLINPPTLSAGGKLFLQRLGFFSRGGSKGVVNVLAYAASLSSKQTHTRAFPHVFIHVIRADGRERCRFSVLEPNECEIVSQRGCICLSACLPAFRTSTKSSKCK